MKKHPANVEKTAHPRSRENDCISDPPRERLTNPARQSQAKCRRNATNFSVVPREPPLGARPHRSAHREPGKSNRLGNRGCGIELQTRRLAVSSSATMESAATTVESAATAVESATTVEPTTTMESATAMESTARR